MRARFARAGKNLRGARHFASAECAGVRGAAVSTLRARFLEAEIVTGVRIGITKAADTPWRYGLKGSKFLSKPFNDPHEAAREIDRRREQNKRRPASAIGRNAKAGIPVASQAMPARTEIAIAMP